MADCEGVDVSDRMCSLDGCDRRYYAKGYCCAHYLRLLKYGDPLAGKPIKRRIETRPGCSVEGCDRQHYARGWCQPHYNRWKKCRDVMADIPVEDRNPRDGMCRVEGCGRLIGARGARRLCVGHLRREDKHGDVMADIPIKEFLPGGPCSVPKCERRRESYGWCNLHYKRFRLYRLTPDDYTVMLAMQGGGCAICGAKPTDTESLHVDHDHACCPPRKPSCGKCVRGLLCSWCNHMLGYARDEPTLLQRGIEYLTAWQRGHLPITPRKESSRDPKPAKRLAPVSEDADVLVALPAARRPRAARRPDLNAGACAQEPLPGIVV